MSESDAWTAFVAEITPHVSPEWLRTVSEHGDQNWIRLIALVDVQNNLTAPQIVEKVAATMADLAQKRPDEQRGWEVLQSSATDRRMQLLRRLDELVPDLLSPELLQLYLRSATPLPSPDM